jgi:hypothetical protein
VSSPPGLPGDLGNADTEHPRSSDEPSPGTADTEHAATPRARTPGTADIEHATTLGEHTPSAGPRAAIPASGERIGRFTVLDTLGRGGMGVVVSAYDPRLDRRVALKLVSTPAAHSSGDHRDRLVREARAMAKLRHPNVVGVYEVGEHASQVYLAMEQVEGGTLRKALVDGERVGQTDWRKVVDLFVQAGHGLAAAHAAGLAHRDFKPDNVLVDSSGRVLVGDFGLVSALQSAASDSEEDAPLRELFTRADAVVGTPAYMAPEQHTAGAVDARADQFAFCVALYEALYGELPFEGETRGGYLASIRRGAIKPPPQARKVPAWLREILRRGLSATPEDRFPSMDVLLAELGADPQRTWSLGWRARAIFVAMSFSFGAIWLGAFMGLDLEFTYKLHYATSIGFFLLLLGVTWIVRRAFARTAFNRTIMSAGVATALIVVLLTFGGHLLAIDPNMLAILYLLSFGSTFLIGAISFDSRLGVAAATYLTGFILASAWPPSFLPTITLAHLIGAICYFSVVSSRGRPGS